MFTFEFGFFLGVMAFPFMMLFVLQIMKWSYIKYKDKTVAELINRNKFFAIISKKMFN